MPQAQTESLADYKRRFDECLATLTAAGCRDIPPAEQTVDFLTNVDSRRFAQLT